MNKKGAVSPARAVSYQILLQMEAGHAHSDELLRTPEVDALSAQDRNLATMLVLGTLRWRMALDARIRAFLTRPDAKLSAETAAALRMGAYQLLYLDRIPAHAAIDESVELVKLSQDRFAAGMVNAVLRKIARAPGDVAAEADSAAKIAAKYAHPLWMVERWARFYGLKAAEAVCAFDQEPAFVTLRLLDEAAEADLQAEGLELEAGELLRGARRVMRGDVTRTEVFRAGRVRIQEEGSQLVAELAAAVVPGAQRILDACAAPGGKTAILAERLGAAEITALDVSKRRLEAMRSFLKRFDAAGRIQFEVADAAQSRLKAEYDLILCDVPCSGTGTIARNPEIRFRVNEAGLARQKAKQVAILKAMLKGLAPGGRLMYSTCSLEPEENEAVVAECLEGDSLVRIVPMGRVLAKSGILAADWVEQVVVKDCLRTVPGVQRCDGFFAVVMERGA
jgi:16S rRNA (cytosine967-C5)-methyltransferase